MALFLHVIWYMEVFWYSIYPQIPSIVGSHLAANIFDSVTSCLELYVCVSVIGSGFTFLPRASHVFPALSAASVYAPSRPSRYVLLVKLQSVAQ